MGKKYYDTLNLERYLGYRSASKMLAQATYRRIKTCRTIGLARLNRAWERDKEALEKTLQRLAKEECLPPSERLQLEARARKLARRMARYKEKARILAARQGILLDV